MITHDPKVAARASRMVRICDGKLEAVSCEPNSGQHGPLKIKNPAKAQRLLPGFYR